MFHSNTQRDDNTMLKIYHLFFIFITKKRKMNLKNRTLFGGYI